MYSSLQHKMKLSTIKTTTTHLLSGKSFILRRLSTATSSPPPHDSPENPSKPHDSPENPSKISKYKLYSQLSEIGLTGQKVTDILLNLTQNGAQFRNSDLVFCLKKLRNYNRHHDCLEILDWMETGEVDYSYHALRLDVISKVKGIDEAEKYFDSLPEDMKNSRMYGTLLNCYCLAKMTGKALAVFEKMREMTPSCDTLAYNNIMGHYVKLSQPEKVVTLIKEMRQSGVPLNSISYQILIQCHGLLNDSEGLEQAVNEAEGQSFIAGDWQILSVIASAFLKIGSSERAAQAMQKMEKVLDNSIRLDRVAYHHMISLYASIGSLESVNRAWGKLISKFTIFHNQSYYIMLQALSKLDNIEGLTKCLESWKERYKMYDVRLPNIAMKAYLKHDILDEAELLLQEAKEKSKQKQWSSHIIFVDYYLRKRQIDSALRHMDSAIANEWKPRTDTITSFFDYFKEEKDVNGAEKLYCVLNKVQPVDSEAYLGLLQTYAAAGTTAPDLCQRMERDHVSLSAEHEDLLNRVCPNSETPSRIQLFRGWALG